MPSSPACEILPWQQGRWDALTASPRLGHALLLAGPAGVGKTRFAHAFARRLLCDEGHGCGHCRSCHLVGAENHPDLMVCAPAPGKTEIPVDTVRELTGFLTLSAHLGRGRVIIIESAERLGRAAANALLKSLEEPPPGAYLLLVSDAPERLLPTVRSRCQRIDFAVPARAAGLAYLQSAGCLQPEEALAQAAGAPLRAAALTAPDLQMGEEMLKSLEGIRQGRLDPLAAAESWHKIDGKAAFAVLADLTARIVQQGVPGASGDPDEPRAKRLQALAGGLDLTQIFQFWDKILDINELLDAPLDRHLIWDEVFLTWKQVSSRKI